jgi:D-alanyl-D-alanine-carboxypeptidase/D-alanyl-D-alanine-endopeptidase
MEAAEAVGLLIERVRSRPWGLAVSAMVGNEADCGVEPGDDPLSDASSFQIGSLTKTLTGVLLGCSVVRGEATLDTTVGDLFDQAGTAKEVTLGALATHRSGLPRLPPNLNLETVDHHDPYASYTEEDLIAALAMIESPVAGRFEYSNFGFMLLGLLLGRITGTPYARLVRERVFEPLAMSSAGCPPPDGQRLPGYAGADRVKWWTTRLPGAGGVGMSIRDLTTYLQAHLDPEGHPLAQPMLMATTIHARLASPAGLGWTHQDGRWWHNGATSGFRSFAAFHRPTRTAVALMANSGTVDSLDGVGFRTLNQLIVSQAR